MIHPEDLEAIEKVFRGDQVPESVVVEYAHTRSIANCWGINGPLGREMVVDLLRRVGVTREEPKQDANVDWRKHVGESVIGHYGDLKVPGKLTGFGDRGRLIVDLNGYGEVELPRYSVKLHDPEQPVVVETDWESVVAGTPVLVGDDAQDGTFVSVSKDGVKVKVGSKQAVYKPEDVSLAEGGE